MEFTILLSLPFVRCEKGRISQQKCIKNTTNYTNCFYVDGTRGGWCHGKRTGNSKCSELGILTYLLWVISIKCIY